MKWLIILCMLLPMLSCKTRRVEQQRRHNEYFAEILKRVDGHWIGDDRFFETHLLKNESPEVRRWCAIALGSIGSHRALPLLYRAIREGDSSTRAAAAFSIGVIENRSLGDQPDPKAVKMLVGLLDDASIPVRMRAVEALGKTGSHQESMAITRSLEEFTSTESSVRRAYAGFASTALARLNARSASPVLEKLAGSSDPEIRWHALDALAGMQEPQAIPLFDANLNNSNAHVAASAARGLSIAGADASGGLIQMLSTRNDTTGKPIPPVVRYSAVQSLAKLKSAAAIGPIKAALEAEPLDKAHPEQQNFAILAAAALGDIGTAEAEPVLAALLHSEEPVANSAVVALAKVLKTNPQRFFSLTKRTSFNSPAAAKAWARSMAELGSPEAVDELKRMLVQAVQNGGSTHADLLPIVLTSLIKVNPPGLTGILSPFLQSKDALDLSAAATAFGGMDLSEPWNPIIQAFHDCCSSRRSMGKAAILSHLRPWVKEAKVQDALWTGLKDPDRGVHFAALSLLRAGGRADAVEFPAVASVTDTMRLAIAASRKNSTIAIVETTRGTLEIELFREDAPLTVADFLLRAGNGGFDGYVFETVDPGQRILTDSMPPEADFSRTVARELNMKPFERGSLGISQAGGNGRLFITLTPQPGLDGIDTCFGHVISGIQAADRIVPGDRILRVTIKETISYNDLIRY